MAKFFGRKLKKNNVKSDHAGLNENRTQNTLKAHFPKKKAYLEDGRLTFCSQITLFYKSEAFKTSSQQNRKHFDYTLPFLLECKNAVENIDFFRNKL